MRLPRLYLRRGAGPEQHEFINYEYWTGVRTHGEGEDFNMGATVCVTEREARAAYVRKLARDKAVTRRKVARELVCENPTSKNPNL